MRKAKLRHEFIQPASWWKRYLRSAYTVLADAQGLRRPLTPVERRGFRRHIQRYLNKRGWIGSARDMATVYHAMRFEREQEAARQMQTKAAAVKRAARRSAGAQVSKTEGAKV